MEPIPIPTPHVLDPDRILVNDRGGFAASHESRAAALETGLKETCEYAQRLWHDLDHLRSYLLNSLPPDPRAPGAHLTASASPTGPDDEEGWENWINAYAAVTSTLAGPHGDSGFGLGRARLAARNRRTAPVVALAAKYPNLTTAAEGSSAKYENGKSSAGRGGWIRGAGTAALFLLALRGLYPRHRRTW